MQFAKRGKKKALKKDTLDVDDMLLRTNLVNLFSYPIQIV